MTKTPEQTIDEILTLAAAQFKVAREALAAIGRDGQTEVSSHITDGKTWEVNSRADHKAQRVVLPVFSGAESVDTFHHVLAAQMRVRAGDTLAFDDRVRVVLACSPEFVDQHQWNIGSTIRRHNSTTGS